MMPLVRNLIITSVLSVYSFSSVQASTLTLCYEAQDYLPYLRAFDNPDSQQTGERGMLPDMAIMAAQELKLDIRFTTSTWKRCIELVRKGQVDGMFAAVYKQEREEWAVYPRKGGQLDHNRRLWTVDYKVYSSADSQLTWDGNVFGGVANGVDAPKGYFTFDRLQQMQVLPPISSQPEKGFQLLTLNRLDGYVLEQYTAEHLISKLDIEPQIKAQALNFASEDLFLVLSHKTIETQPELAESFWDALASVRNRMGQRLLNIYRHR